MPMTKSLKERGLDPFVQAHRRRSKDIYEYFKFFGSQMKHNQRWQRSGLMWNILGEQVSMMETWKNSCTSVHDGDVEEFLIIKTPQKIRGRILED